MERARLIDRPSPAGSRPFGTAWLPELQMGIDLAAAGYDEREWTLEAAVAVWGYDDAGAPVSLRSDLSARTRLLVRRPAEPERFSGVVVLEPLHPDLDQALLWNALAPWILEQGHAWAGVTVYPHTAEQLRTSFAPERYADLDIPAAGVEFDLLGAAAVACADEEAAGAAADTILVGGMSATGSLCRVFHQDGFRERWTRRDGRPAVDAVLIGISSGGAPGAGYPPLSPGVAELPMSDPRRVVAGRGAAVAEVLSETESETHESMMRDDGDEPRDRYRLYQVAGTAHIEARPSILVNRHQAELAGVRRPAFETVEEVGDGRLDGVLRAVADALVAWVRADQAPPRAERFVFEGPELLARDADGNVTGGVRTPWIAVPTARYAPHSTAADSCEPPPEWMPFARPEMLARLVGARHPFPAEELLRRYGSRAGYLERYAEAVRASVASGLLREPDALELLREAPGRWRG